MENFDLANLAVKMLAPNNGVLSDDTNLPSIMVWIPKFRLCDVLNTEDTSTHCAFRVNGQEISGFWFGKYQSTVYGNVAYSLPGEDPAANINFDNSRARCEAKGNAWHLTTVAEWAAVALWSKANGTMPKGNNNYGRDTTETIYKAIPSMARDGSNRIQRVATGTGPVTWSHDGTIAGAWDMNGNVSEWLGGFRLVNGEIQIIPDNNAADHEVPQTAASTAWKAIDAATGELVTPNGSGTTEGTVKLDYVTNHWEYTTSITHGTGAKQCTFETVVADETIGADAKLLLQELAMLPEDGASAGDYGGDTFYANNSSAEVVPFRGGRWSNTGGAGVFFVTVSNARAISYPYIGFRCSALDPAELGALS